MLAFLVGCIPTEENLGGGLCTGFDFSIIDKYEWEENGNLVNLVGKDGQPFHPDDIVIVSQQLDTMFSKSGKGGLVNSLEDWWMIGGFSYFDDLGCIGITERIDLRYFVHLNQDDTDTMDIVLKPSPKGRVVQIYYNNTREVLPTDSGTSSYWFLKEY